MALASRANPKTLESGHYRQSPTAKLVTAILTLGPDLPRPLNVKADDFVSWGRRNKVPLIGLASRFPRWLACDPIVSAALDAERDWYATQRREYLAVEAAWRERGIDCLMIKSAGNPPSFPHTSDNIDILVRPESGQAARDVLRSLGYLELRNIEEPEKFLFRLYRGGRCVSAIHVHERIAWFVGFLDDGAVWGRSRPSEDDPRVRIPSPGDAVLINLAHACYENKELRLVEVLRTRHAVQSAGADFDWSYLSTIATKRGWLDGLGFMLMVHATAERSLFGDSVLPEQQLEPYRAAINDDDAVRRRIEAVSADGVTDLPLNLGYGFCKRLYYRKILRDPTRNWNARGRDLAATLIWGVRLKSRLRPQPGMIVTLSGPDGSGKTTQAKALVAALRQCEIKADYLWSRGGSTGLLGIASNCRRFLRKSEPATTAARLDAISRRRRRLRHPLVRFTWAWLVALDQLATYWWRAYLPARFGRVVVADRYLYDAIIELGSTLLPESRWSRAVMRAMLATGPRPTIGFVLDVSLDTAQARKPDENWHKGWRDERQEYLSLARSHRLKVLSTEGSLDESCDKLIHEVMMAFMTRYETRLNGLLYSNPSQKNEPDPFWIARAAQ